jgi:hypothetical protein
MAGENLVPFYDDRPISHKDIFNVAYAKMKMCDYVDLLLSKPTNYRIFLYNLIKEIHSLKMSLRAFPVKLSNVTKAIYNILIMRNLDNFMRKWKGQQWIDYKNDKAMTRTHKRLN